MSKKRFVLSEQRLKRIGDVVSGRQRGLTVVLEDVHDPHNAAAVLRSCDGFGVQKVHFVFTNQEEYDPRKIGKQSSSSVTSGLIMKFIILLKTAIKLFIKKNMKRGQQFYLMIAKIYIKPI